MRPKETSFQERSKVTDFRQYRKKKLTAFTMTFPQFSKFSLSSPQPATLSASTIKSCVRTVECSVMKHCFAISSRGRTNQISWNKNWKGKKHSGWFDNTDGSLFCIGYNSAFLMEASRFYDLKNLLDQIEATTRRVDFKLQRSQEEDRASS